MVLVLLGLWIDVARVLCNCDSLGTVMTFPADTLTKRVWKELAEVQDPVLRHLAE